MQNFSTGQTDFELPLASRTRAHSVRSKTETLLAEIDAGRTEWVQYLTKLLAEGGRGTLVGNDLAARRAKCRSPPK
jgi:hypothetical protein